MSNEEKVALAETTKSDYRLPAVFPQGHRDDVAVLELPRSTWYYHQKHVKAYTEKYAHLQELLEAIARENPAYGYRRTTEELNRCTSAQNQPQGRAKASPGVGFAAHAQYQAAETKWNPAGHHSSW